MYSALKEKFSISKFPCLTDSAITLAWIENEKKHYKQSVQNQFTEVRELTKTDMWYLLLGNENIADLSRRECLSEELSSKSSNWINHSCWLTQEISTWAISKNMNRFTNKAEEKFIKTEMRTSPVSAIILTEKMSTISLENVTEPY